MNKYTIPYQYTVIGHATVMANSLEEAVELTTDSAPCPIPENERGADEQIIKVRFSYLNESFEIHEEDLDIVNNL